MGIKNTISTILDEYIELSDAVAWIAKCEEVSTSEAAEWLLMHEAHNHLQFFFLSGASVSDQHPVMAGQLAQMFLKALAKNQCKIEDSPGPNFNKRDRSVVKVEDLRKFVTENDSSIELNEEIRPHYKVNSMNFFERTALLEGAIRALSARFQCETGLVPDLSDDFPDLDISLSGGLLRDFKKGPYIGSQLTVTTEKDDNPEPGKPENPSETVLKMLAGLALVLSEKGGKYRRGERPNQKQIAEEIEKICQGIPNADAFGLSAESIRKHISQGLALLGNT